MGQIARLKDLLKTTWQRHDLQTLNLLLLKCTTKTRALDTQAKSSDIRRLGKALIAFADSRSGSSSLMRKVVERIVAHDFEDPADTVIEEIKFIGACPQTDGYCFSCKVTHEWPELPRTKTGWAIFSISGTYRREFAPPHIPHYYTPKALKEAVESMTRDMPLLKDFEEIAKGTNNPTAGEDGA